MHAETTEVVNAWDTFANRKPLHEPLLDHSDDMWMDAKLDSVEEWLHQRIQTNASKRRAQVWSVDDDQR